MRATAKITTCIINYSGPKHTQMKISCHLTLGFAVNGLNHAKQLARCFNIYGVTS